jgi:feruloyl esterase
MSRLVLAVCTTLAMAVLLAPPAALAASPAACAALTSASLPQTTISATTWKAATSALPEHCRVEGVIGPGSIRFAVQLPSNWNGKLYHQGGGGYVGTIPVADTGLQLGYATAATDTGHTGNALDGTWALNNDQARIDFGYRAIHVTTEVAKGLVRAYYGSGPHRAYFLGCSRGGGQGLMEAQRFPDDFDGILVGAPAYHWTEFMTGFNWNERALAAGPVPTSKLPLISKAVLANCDGKDGLVDGLVQDPRRCTFDPISLLCSGADAPDCLTAAQVSAVRKVYAGPVNSWGDRLSPGFPMGSEDLATGWASWISGGAVTPSLQFTFQDQFFRYLVFNNPAYDPFTLNYDTDPLRLMPAGLIYNATDPDLSHFRRQGGKIVMYHGTNDHALSLYKTIQYYEDVQQVMGRGVDHFFRFFFVPGMHHCAGGPGLNTFDAFSALVAWVEKGQAPERIVATGTLMPGRSRPLCPYPRQAHYIGHGSIDDAASFACAVPHAEEHER